MCFPAEQEAQEGVSITLLHCFLAIRLHLQVINAAPCNQTNLPVGLNVLNFTIPFGQELEDGL